MLLLCCILLYLHFEGPTHVVVKFSEDGTTALVPIKKLTTTDEVKVGDTCNIKWTDRIQYEATVQAIGTYHKLGIPVNYV